jgi:putative aldouronate transport system permease protein
VNASPSKLPVLLSQARSPLQRFLNEIVKQKFLLVLLAPGVVFFIIFRYIPIGNLYLAFTNSGFKATTSFVGFENFQRLILSQEFWNAFRNTLILAGLNIVFYFPLPIIFALLMNEMRQVAFKRTLQFIYYIPYFFSWVVVGGIFITLLSPSNGLINNFLRAIGAVDPDPQRGGIYFFAMSGWFRQILIASHIWRNVGYGMVIYIATLETIDPQLYDAATVDGATYWQKMIHVTLPGLATTIAVMLLLNLSSILRTFDQIIAMYNDAVLDVSDVIMTYSFRNGLYNSDIGYATAISSFTAIVTVILILGLNTLSKRVLGESIL